MLPQVQVGASPISRTIASFNALLAGGTVSCRRSLRPATSVAAPCPPFPLPDFPCPLPSGEKEGPPCPATASRRTSRFPITPPPPLPWLCSTPSNAPPTTPPPLLFPGAG